MSSWFTDLAGKAEAFLDRVDQATASTLQDAGITPKSTHSSAVSAKDSSQQSVAQSLSYEPTAGRRSSTPSSERGQGSTVAQVLVGGASDSPLRLKSKSGPLGEAKERGEQTSLSRPSSGSARRSSDSKSITPKATRRENDEVLFEFLNTPSSVKTKTSKTIRSTPKIKTASVSSSGSDGHVTEQGVSMLSDPLLSPVKAQPSPLQAEEVHVRGSEDRSQWSVSDFTRKSRSEAEREGASGAKVEETDGHVDSKAAPVKNQERDGRDEKSEPVATEKVEDGERLTDETSPQPAQSGSHVVSEAQQNEEEKELVAEVDTLRQKVSNLELENKLLKREVASLNDEMGTLMTRLNEASDTRVHHDEEMLALREQVSQSDHVIRQLRSHDDDLQALLEARDQQIAVLRAQLTEGDRTAEQLRAGVSAAQREREQLLQDANLSSDAQNQALVSLKNKLAQTESSLSDERERAESARWASAQRESELEAEKTHLSEALSSLQKQVEYQQMKIGESQAAVRSAQNENQLLRREYEEYKQRAAGILQAKEKLISSLQGGGGEGVRNAVSEAQLQEMKLEKEHVQAQLLTVQQQLESCKATMQEMEERYQGEMDGLSEQLQVCEGVLTEEKRMHSAAQQEISKLNQELEVCRDDSLREKSSLLEQIKERDSEMATLRSKLLTSSPDKAELESRLRELTESLIQKQTTLETLNSERHSLNLQMQRMQAQLSDAQRFQTHQTDTSVVVNGLETAAQDTSRIRPISSVLSTLDDAPSESRLHNVKRAVNTVDRFSIRLGVFLRRYPHARLFALLYVILLHIWVMVVLLTYTPEAHGPNDFLHN